MADIKLTGPSRSEAVINSATVEGAIGRANDKSLNAAKRMFDRSEFDLKKKDSRTATWGATIRNFAKGGACFGHAAANVMLFPADLVTGKGVARPEGERAHFLDKGALGYAASAGSAIGTAMTEIGGGLVGGAYGLATLPAKSANNEGSKSYVKDHVATGAGFGESHGAHVLGGSTGLALSSLRILPTAARYSTASLCAVAGGAIGVVAGLPRAVFNV